MLLKSTKKFLIKIIESLNENHLILVYLHFGTPIGIITVIIEQKLIHIKSCLGHIEDLIFEFKI